MDNALFQLAANQPQINQLSLGSGPRLQQMQVPNLNAFYLMAAKGAHGLAGINPVQDYLNAKAAKQQLEANQAGMNALASQRQQQQERQNAIRQAVSTGDISSLAEIDPEAANQVRKYHLGDEVQQILQKPKESWTPEDKSKLLLLDEGRKAVDEINKMEKSRREKILFSAQNVGAGIAAIRNNPQAANEIWPQIRPHVAQMGIVPPNQVPEQIDQDSLGELEAYTGALLNGASKLKGAANVNVDVKAQPNLDQIFARQEAREAGKKSVEFEKELNDALTSADEAEYRADRMMALAKEVERTGLFTPYENRIREALTSLGFDDAADANKEELERLGNEAVMQVLLKFKGSTSAKEWEYAKTQVGDITKSKGGIRRFALIQKALAQRVREKAALYDEYLSKHNDSPKGFTRAWLRYQRKHPFIPRVRTTDEARKLPPGTVFRGPKNKLMVVP